MLNWDILLRILDNRLAQRRFFRDKHWLLLVTHPAMISYRLGLGVKASLLILAWLLQWLLALMVVANVLEWVYLFVISINLCRRCLVLSWEYLFFIQLLLSSRMRWKAHNLEVKARYLILELMMVLTRLLQLNIEVEKDTCHRICS